MRTNDYPLTPVDCHLTLYQDLLRANSTNRSHKTQILLMCFWKIKTFAAVEEKVQGNSQGSSNISKAFIFCAF